MLTRCRLRRCYCVSHWEANSLWGCYIILYHSCLSYVLWPWEASNLSLVCQSSPQPIRAKSVTLPVEKVRSTLTYKVTSTADQSSFEFVSWVSKFEVSYSFLLRLCSRQRRHRRKWAGIDRPKKGTGGGKGQATTHSSSKIPKPRSLGKLT